MCARTYTHRQQTVFSSSSCTSLSSFQMKKLGQFPFMSLNGESSQMPCAPLEKHSLPSVLGHFCLGDSPPGDAIIFRGYGLRCQVRSSGLGGVRSSREQSLAPPRLTQSLPASWVHQQVSLDSTFCRDLADGGKRILLKLLTAAKAPLSSIKRFLLSYKT